MSQIEITADMLNGLAAKIDEAGLSPEEAAVLNAVLDRASRAEADVEGYGHYQYGTRSLKAEAAGEGDSYMLGLSRLKAEELDGGGRRWGQALRFGPTIAEL